MRTEEELRDDWGLLKGSWGALDGYTASILGMWLGDTAIAVIASYLDVFKPKVGCRLLDILPILN